MADDVRVPNKFRKKPVVVEAVQWFKDGDHAKVSNLRNPDPLDCELCGKPYRKHGTIRTLEDTDKMGHLVCPEDWVIKGVKGEHYACKPDIFAATYEPAAPSPAAPAEGKPVPCVAVPPSLAAPGDNRALYIRVREFLLGTPDNVTDLVNALQTAIESPAATICRDDGRCQYAIEHDAEGMGHCPDGQCAMPTRHLAPIDGNHANTALENWFPFSAEELKRARPDGMEFAAKICDGLANNMKHGDGPEHHSDAAKQCAREIRSRIRRVP